MISSSSNECVDKYLEAHAEKAALSIAAALPNQNWKNCVVIPLMGEADWTQEGLESLAIASRQTQGQTLAILIINEHPKVSQELQAENRRCIQNLLALLGPRNSVTSRATVLQFNSFLSLLMIDLTAREDQFSSKEGVGIARKFGMDLATKLVQMKKLETQFLHTTDGDVVMEPDYFTATESAPKDCGVFLHPFQHTGIYEQTDALTLYEISLRYYVLGLQNAGSPYAFQTIGSTIAISAFSYTSVRGFPKRNAAEDFYLLNKVAKTSKIYSSRTGKIQIKGRVSDRVPFGTGVGASKIWQSLQSGDTPSFYSPDIFELLKILLIAIQSACTHKDLEQFLVQLRELVGLQFGKTVETAFLELIQTLEVKQMLAIAIKSRSSKSAIFKHMMESFDAFKTLKFVHGVRDSILPNIEWEKALEKAPFLDGFFFKQLSSKEILNQLSNKEMDYFVAST